LTKQLEHNLRFNKKPKSKPNLKMNNSIDGGDSSRDMFSEWDDPIHIHKTRMMDHVKRGEEMREKYSMKKKDFVSKLDINKLY